MQSGYIYYGCRPASYPDHKLYRWGLGTRLVADKLSRQRGYEKLIGPTNHKHSSAPKQEYTSKTWYNCFLHISTYHHSDSKCTKASVRGNHNSTSKTLWNVSVFLGLSHRCSFDT